MERLCRECASPIVGRSDKRFCSDDCRTAYHNRQYRSESGSMSQTNRILRRNRRILSGIFAAGISKISLTDRRVKGFDTSCFTAVKRHLLRREEYYCYEFSYVLAGGRICRLSKHDVAGRLISARPTDSA